MAVRFSVGEGISQLIYVGKYRVSVVWWQSSLW